jgi:hypothetical protein
MSRDFGEFPMCNFIEATRDLCDDLERLVDIAKQSRAPIRALSLIERARADLQAYLDEIDPAFPGQIKFKALAAGSS